MVSSETSCHSSENPDEYSPPIQTHSPTPSPSPTPVWSSDPSSTSSDNNVPLSQRWVIGRAPTRAHPVAARAPRVQAETPEDSASIVTGQVLRNIRAYYQISASIQLFIPTPDDRVISSRPRRVTLYEAHFRASLHFSLHLFIINLLDLYSLTPTQLVPNSIRTICFFLVLCHLLGIEVRVSLFRSFYNLHQQSGWWLFQPRPSRALKLGLPTSVKGWKA